MAFWGALFGGTAAAEKAIEGGVAAVKKTGELLDDAFYTKEERAVQMSKAFSEHLEFMKTTLQENSIRSVTRRIMAWTIVAFIVISFTISSALELTAGIIRERAVIELKGLSGQALQDMQLYVALRGTHLEEASANIIQLIEVYQLGWSFVGVIVFYFGIQLLRAKQGNG